MDSRNVFPEYSELRDLLENSFNSNSVDVLEDSWHSIATGGASCGVYRIEGNPEQRFEALLESRNWFGRQFDSLVFIRDQELLVLSTEEQPKLQLLRLSSGQKPQKILCEAIQTLISSGTLNAEDIAGFQGWQEVISDFLFDTARAISDRPQASSNEFPRQSAACLLAPEIRDSLVRWTLADDVESVVDVADGNGGFPRAINEFAEDRRNGEVTRFVFQHDHSLIGLGGVLLDYYFAGEWEEWAPLEFDEILSNDSGVLTDRTLEEFAEQAAHTEGHHSSKNFDAAIGMPWPIAFPELPERYRDHLRSISEIRRPTMAEVLSLEVIRKMSDGGKGSFILPSHIWRPGEYPTAIRNHGRIHAIIRSVEPYIEDSPLDSRFQFDILLFEKAQKETEEPVRILALQEDRFPDDFDRLLHAPSERIAQREWDDEPIEIGFIQQDDLSEFPPEVVLSEPSLAGLFRSDEFEALEDHVTFHRMRATGDNEFFYFGEEEMISTEISDQFFTPLIKRLPTDETKYSITMADIDQYALDIREYLESISDTPMELTEDDVLDALEADGYDALLEYIQSHEKPDRTYHSGSLWFCPFPLNGRPVPDLVFSQIGDARWCTVNLDQVVVDQTSYCAYVTKQSKLEVLHALLNSNLYQRFAQQFGRSFGAGYAQFNIRELRRIPILSNVFLPDNAEKIRSHFPPETRRQEHELDSAIIEICDSSEAKEGLEYLFTTDDEFAWAWFLDVEEYQQFKDLYADEPSKAEEFIAERITPKDIDEILETFTGSELIEQRASILTEVVDEYNNGKYRLFLYGIAPQFEGVLIDWAEERGYDTEVRNGLPHIRIPATESESDEEYIPKRLTDLISTFLPGRFGGFLDDEIREIRNKLTHGELVDANQQKATVFLLCLHALCRQITQEEIENTYR